MSQDNAFSGSADQCEIREVDVCVFTDWAKTPSVTQSPYSGLALRKGPATRNDFVNDIVNDARADAIFATLKAIVDDEKSTISSMISLRVAWPLLVWQRLTIRERIGRLIISKLATAKDHDLSLAWLRCRCDGTVAVARA